MFNHCRYSFLSLAGTFCFLVSLSQQQEAVSVVKEKDQNKINIFIGGKPFTSFLYPDSLEKPVLYPVHAASGAVVTRGYPIDPQPNDPTDHPHHLGIWLNFENVNGLDFWNNSFAIPPEKKKLYGWIKTNRITETSGGNTGTLTYTARWVNQQQEQLLEENTRLQFSGTKNQRIIDRVTVLKATTEVLFKDAKDGLLGIRVAHALEIPTMQDQQFTDDKGNITLVKGGTDTIPSGNFMTSEGKTGNDAWSTRARWCKMYGKLGKDSVSITIVDHPANPNYPTYWHARGYGLFAANPLGENIFTNGKITKNLQLKKGETVTFRYRIIINNGIKSMDGKKIDQLADAFGKSK